MTTPIGPRFDTTIPPPGRNARSLRCIHAFAWRITEKIYLPERVMPPHAHDFSNVTYVLSGAIEEVANGRRAVLRAGSWIVKPAGTEHANRVGRHGVRVLEFVRTAETTGDGWTYRIGRGGVEVLTFLRLFRELRERDAAAGEAIDRLCDAIPGGPAATGKEPGRMTAVRDRLRECRGNVTLGGLAREFRIHPTYLARVFRRRFGCSVGEYARQVRVEAAARRLASRAAPPLSAIALASGFADQSHMTRIFRSCTGMTPAAYRRLLRE